jgi:hypothetical protein
MRRLNLNCDHAVERISYEEAHSLLFPIGSLDWRPWEKPDPELCIDDIVKILIRSRRAPRVERQEFLARDPLFGSPHSRGEPCPFYVARMGTVLSASRASEQLAMRILARGSASPSRWQRIHNHLSDALEELQKFDGGAPERRTHDLYFLTDGPDETASINENRRVLVQAIEAGMLVAATEKNRLAPPHKVGDVWKQVFVINLGYTWHTLTGCNPKGTDFVKFLDSAHASLGAISDVDWERHVKRALARNETMGAFHRWGGRVLDAKAPAKIEGA